MNVSKKLLFILAITCLTGGVVAGMEWDSNLKEKEDRVKEVVAKARECKELKEHFIYVIDHMHSYRFDEKKIVASSLHEIFFISCLNMMRELVRRELWLCGKCRDNPNQENWKEAIDSKIDLVRDVFVRAVKDLRSSKEMFFVEYYKLKKELDSLINYSLKREDPNWYDKVGPNYGCVAYRISRLYKPRLYDLLNAMVDKYPY